MRKDDPALNAPAGYTPPAERPIVLQEGPLPAPKPKQKHTGINRLLGATAGPSAGNVRAILAIMLCAAFCVLLGYAMVEYLHFSNANAHDLVVGGFGALIAAFNGVIFYYIGRRSAETG